MNNVKQWTPIQEGRFYLRLMHEGEAVPQLIKRIYPPGRFSPAHRRKIKRRIDQCLPLALAEREKARQDGRSEGKHN